MILPRTRQGLTLIEVLAALVLLGAFTAALSALAVSTTTTARRLESQARTDAMPARALAILQRDSDESWPGSVVLDPAGLITLTTTHALPGESLGWAEVRWELEEFALTRHRTMLRSTPNGHSIAAREILRGVSDFSVDIAEPGEAIPTRVTVAMADGALASVQLPPSAKVPQ